MRLSTVLLVVLLVNALSVVCSVADEVTLVTGARLIGLCSRELKESAAIQFTSEHGIRLKIRPSQVLAARVDSPALQEYGTRAPIVPDTAESQWQLAEWCRARGLDVLRRRHLQRVIELHPSHVLARRALGYSQIDGRWATQSQVLLAKGYVLHRGRWRLPQEVELLERRRQLKEAQAVWRTHLRQWRSQLKTPDGIAAGELIRRIRDPHAVRALDEFLERDQDRRAKLFYVEALGNIFTDRASLVLLNTALRESDEEVFHASVEQIVRRNNPSIVTVLSKTLQSTNNRHVNRAAYVLSQLGDESAIAPLIEALITTHPVHRTGSRRTTFTFSQASPRLAGASAGSDLDSGVLPGGMLPGGMQFSPPRRSQTRTVRVLNQDVLDALDRLVGGTNFGFDLVAWRHWYAGRNGRRAPHPLSTSPSHSRVNSAEREGESRDRLGEGGRVFRTGMQSDSETF